MARVAAVFLCCLLGIAPWASTSAAQDSSCLNQLIPCLDYVASSKAPPGSCCSALRSVIGSDPRCLCSMLDGNSPARQGGVNMTQAQRLPARCGLPVTAAACSGLPSTKTTGPSSSSAACRFSLLNADLRLIAALMLVVAVFSSFQ